MIRWDFGQRNKATPEGVAFVCLHICSYDTFLITDAAVEGAIPKE